ncbi:VC2046/SO_2500 family protein [Planctobacterium marinum]|uniref:VC2046/SO_2500 family protein n=1 Tax=Planctobacterium marinum TaxID=1631968 RepID=UPI001E5B2DDA|nr:VC2046/SO_2500 family protein [Planctobacterium marinum]MCC2604230.1 hypothetical protein [Planctobacterium marinum]
MDNNQKTTVNPEIRQTEFKTGLGRALRHGSQSDFALLLSMMQQDITQRLKVEGETEDKPVGLIPIEKFNFYPEVPLKTEKQHYLWQQEFAGAIQRNDLPSAKLLAYMHPTPLSLYNDVKRIPDDVTSNCDMFTQLKIKGLQSENIQVDETLLYDTVREVREKGLD